MSTGHSTTVVPLSGTLCHHRLAHFWLTKIAREQPTAPCTVVLADQEWRALYAHIRRTAQPPATVPTVAEAMVWIARLGGFLARRGDGQPGATVIWRGWQRLNDIVDTWLLFNTP